METRDQLESIAKLRQRLIRLIRLGEPNPLRPSVAPNETVDLTEQVEECVRRLFNTSSTIDGFVQDVQRLLNVTIKTNLTVFLFETIPIAQEYLRQQNCDPYSWDTFKALSIEVPTTVDASSILSIIDLYFSLLRIYHRRRPLDFHRYNRLVFVFHLLVLS